LNAVVGHCSEIGEFLVFWLQNVGKSARFLAMRLLFSCEKDGMRFKRQKLWTKDVE